MSIEKRLQSLEAAVQPERDWVIVYELDGIFYDGNPFRTKTETSSQVLTLAEVQRLEEALNVIRIKYVKNWRDPLAKSEVKDD